MHKILGAFFLAITLVLTQAQDPTKPMDYREVTTMTVKKKSNQLTLYGVVGSKGEKVAIINDQILQLGDQIEGYKLVAIGHDQATLRSKNKEIILNLIKSKVVQKKAGKNNE